MRVHDSFFDIENRMRTCVTKARYNLLVFFCVIIASETETQQTHRLMPDSARDLRQSISL